MQQKEDDESNDEGVFSPHEKANRNSKPKYLEKENE